MPSNYAGNPANYPAQIQRPSDGDGPGINAVDVNVAIEGLADRTANLNGKIALPSGGLVRRAVNAVPNACVNTQRPRDKLAPFVPTTRWWNGSANIDYVDVIGGVLTMKVPPDLTITQFTVGLLYNLNPYLVNGATLTQVDVAVKAAAHSALPARVLSVGVFRTLNLLQTPEMQSLWSVGDWRDDPSGSTAAYAAQHLVSHALDQNNVIDKALYTYWAQFWDEAGANSVVGNTMFGFDLYMSGVSSLRVP